MIREWRAVRRSLFLPGSRKFWALKNDTNRLVFFVILASADDEGRLEGTPEDVKMLAPRSKMSLARVKEALEDMEKQKLIICYDGFVQIMNFVEMQSWHGLTGRSSNIPPPPNHNGVSTNMVSTGFYRPSQAIAIAEMRLDEDEIEKRESEGKTNCDFHNFAKRYRHLTGKKAQATRTNRQLYEADCHQYGETKVLELLGLFAEESSADFLQQGVAAWKFLKDEIHELADSPAPNGATNGAGKKHFRSKAEEREAHNDEVLERVLGRPAGES